jgi:carbonic anhydrase/acetyltransferase-like protein (isoleucine patch superfamily)
MIRSFNGKTPVIAESAFICESASIIGDVQIGENCSVWPGAVIRGDFGCITIGNNTAVEDNVVLHAGSPTPGAEQRLVIGEYSHIGHGAVINCSRIGNHVLVGMNATLLHDVVIGDYCIIAAASLVRQGMQVPNKSFVVGVPARIKKEATPEQLWWVEQAPEEYLKLMMIYKKEGGSLSV